jgi:hypothetical protein
VLRLQEGAELFHLAFPDQRGGIGSGNLLGQPTDDQRARGIRQAGQLVEVLGEMVGIVAPLARRTNQDGALDRRLDGDQWTDDRLRGVTA